MSEHQDAQPGRVRRAVRAAVRAFTVVEMLVVVGIMALLTIGIAQIFRVTGTTVRAGRRVSNLTNYASLVEKQMRKDFSSMTRNGFLVIRNSTAGGTAPFYAGDSIKLTATDNAPRQRRADSIVFFAEGDFTSLRDPVYPTRQAKSTQARIYYGFGLRKNPNDATYTNPVDLDDPNNTNATPGFGQPGPNQYASQWTLLRHATLLCPPKVMLAEKLPNTIVEPATVYQAGDPNSGTFEDFDSKIQIDLQPAAGTIFLNLYNVEPSVNSNRFANGFVVRDEVRGGKPQRPAFSSGVIDIATTDLSEIRAIVMDAQQIAGRSNPFNLDDDYAPNNSSVLLDAVAGSSFSVDLTPQAPDSITKRMHAWMRNAFPTNEDAGVRMRYEPSPPDFIGSRGNANGAVYDRDYKRTDQNMLSAFNFVPGCTEFIVEWSFGKVFPNNDALGRGGQIIWHGVQRNAGATPTGQPGFGAQPYGGVTNANNADWYYMPYRELNGKIGHWPPLPVGVSGGLPGNVFLVGERTNSTGGPGGPGNSPVQYWYFGYVDPTYRPFSAYTDLNNNGQPDVIPPSTEVFIDKNHNGQRDPDEPVIGNGNAYYDPGVNNEQRDLNSPDSIPWPWPKLIRVTMNIVDQNDPGTEQTFQFIFEVPTMPGEAQ